MSPIWLMLLSILCLSLSSFFAKLLADVVLLNILLLVRLGVPATIMLVFSYCRRAKYPDLSTLKILGKRSVFIALAQLCFFMSLTQLSLIEVAVLFSTGPLFIPLIEKLLYSKAISAVTLLTLMASFVGVLLQSQVLSGVEFRWALLTGLLSGFFSACSQVFMYRASKINLDATVINGVTFALALLIVLPMAFLFNPPENTSSSSILLDHTGLHLVLVLIMGSLSVGTQVFRTKAYQKATSTAEFAPIFYLNICFAALLQITFFEVLFTYEQILGLAIISVSCLTYAMSRVIKRRHMG